ncbi:MAG: mechanosensitive ion channel domain-containing protein [Fuerstiella sp.]
MLFVTRQFSVSQACLVVLFLAASTQNLFAQPPAIVPSVDSAIAENASPDIAVSFPSVAELTAQRQAEAQNTALDEATHAVLDQHYAKAIENLQSIEQTEARIKKLAAELEATPQRVIELQERLGKPMKTEAAPPDAASVTELEQMVARLKAAELAAATARKNLSEITTEIDRRAARRQQLAELRAQTDQQLQEVGQQLAAPTPEGEIPDVTTVRTLRLQSRQLRLKREIEFIDQESRTYEGTLRRWTMERDITDRDVREFDRLVQYWQERSAAARRLQAEDEARLAREAAALSHKSIRAEADHNATLADENTQLVTDLRNTQRELDGVNSQLESRRVAFTLLKKRAEAAEFSQAIGVLLRNQKMALPDRDDIYYRVQSRQADVSRLNLKLMEWEAERKPLLDLTAAATRIIEKLDTKPEAISDEELLEQVQAILAARLKLLGDSLENGNTHLDRMVELDSQEKSLLGQVDEESHWLAEHVLWVRSTGVLGSHPQTLLKSLTVLFDGATWANVGKVVAGDASEYFLGWGSAFIILLCALVLRLGMKRRLKALGEVAGRSSCTIMAPTVKALLLTSMIAAPFPVAIWMLGTRVSGLSRGENTLQALGLAMQMTALCWAAIEFVRQIAQPHGLGDSHFDWTEKSMILVRRTMRFLMITLLPALALTSFTAFLGDEELVTSIGRIAYLVAIGTTGWALFQLLRPTSPILIELANENSDELIWRTRWVWLSLIFVTPVLLAVLSLAGFHYTAIQLAGRVSATAVCVLVALFVTAVLSRWLLVTYRQLAIRRGRERRLQMQQAAAVDPDQPIPQDTTPELRLADINIQTRRLLQVVAGLATLLAVYLIWIDALPALGVLKNIPLGWDNDIVTQTDGDNRIPIPVTAADLLFAIAIAGLTLVGARNLPGLMEIVILQRLPLDAGARYAASTVSRYLIVVTGFLLGFRAVGIGWSSVQWLIAAMTVGLGFGLQESFANFVSGIILLFERPIRVGDTVTIGDITGTVTRIQIRATTILDWDNKELIVPNREFVTGNLVNWTLSNSTLRLIVSVGVAYGSDNRLVTELLYRVTEENPNVLDEPEPVVVFSEFGASSLNFDLRIYVNGLMHYRRLKHDLHLKIDDLFREHGIEIAFPQQDLHIRTLPRELQRPDAMASATGEADHKDGGTPA